MGHENSWEQWIGFVVFAIDLGDLRLPVTAIYLDQLLYIFILVCSSPVFRIFKFLTFLFKLYCIFKFNFSLTLKLFLNFRAFGTRAILNSFFLNVRF